MNVGTNDRNHKIMKFLMEVSEIWNEMKHLLAHTSVLRNEEDGNVIECHWKCHKPVVEVFCCQSTAWSMNIKIRNLPSCPTTCRYIFNRFLIKVIPAFIKEVGITIILNFFIALTCVVHNNTHAEEISGNIPAVRFSKASPIIFSLSTEQYQRFMLTERKRQEKAFECLVHINNR